MENELKGLELAQSISEDFVAGIDYTTIPQSNKPFLTQSGASKLAQGFGYKTDLVELREYNEGGECRITVILNIVNVQTQEVVTGAVGTWDSSERGSSDRQRGMQMAYKRAYVMGIRYATYSHELFTQDEDIVVAIEQKAQEPTSHVDEQTGEKMVVPAEMRWDSDKKALVFAHYGAKVKDKSVVECVNDSNVGKGYMEWILNLGSDPSKRDNQGRPEKPCSDELRTHIVSEIKRLSGVSNEKPDTPDIDMIAQVNHENRNT